MSAGTAVTWVYLFGVVVAWRFALRFFAKDFAAPYQMSWEAFLFGLVTGFGAAWFWPVAVVVFGVYRLAQGDPERAFRVVAGESKSDKIERLERELREAQAQDLRTVE